jgi:hypothetical protein
LKEISVSYLFVEYFEQVDRLPTGKHNDQQRVKCNTLNQINQKINSNKNWRRKKIKKKCQYIIKKNPNAMAPGEKITATNGAILGVLLMTSSRISNMNSHADLYFWFANGPQFFDDLYL